MAKNIQHKTLEVHAKLKDLRQRDLEIFGAALAEEGVLLSASQRRGANVRAALKAGWFEVLQPEMTVESVADQHPAVIKLLGEAIDTIYGEVTAIPPE